MRLSGNPLTAAFAIVVLSAAAWMVGCNSKSPLVPGLASQPTEEEDVGPAISPTGPYPKATTAETEHNFGAMLPGSHGKHVFTIRNDGEADLVLMAREEDTTCSCTFGELSSDNSIKPGESVDVTLNWHIKIPDGEFRHQAVVRTNDPERRKIELVIVGDVTSPLVVRPEGTWELGEFLTSEPITKQGTIHSTHLEAFEVKSIRADSSFTEFNVTPLSDEQLVELDARSGYQLTATVTPEMPIGLYSTLVTIQTDVESVQDFTFELKGTRPGPIDIVGPGFFPKSNAMLLGEFPASEGKSTTLSLFAREIEGDLEIDRLEQTYDSVKLELTKDEKFAGKTSQRYLLKITVPPGEPQDRQRKLSEKIELKFKNPDVPAVRIIVDFLST